MKTRDISAVVDRLRQKDPAIIGELLDAYGDVLYGNIIRIVRSRELAEEVLQEAFLKVWENGARYDQAKGTLFTWLLNIARNTAIDATRTAHFQNSINVELFSESDGQPEPIYPPLDYLDLPAHMAKLDEKYRILIDLLYFEGYTQEEISKEMNIPVGTIKTRLRSAVKKLRKVFLKGIVFN